MYITPYSSESFRRIADSAEKRGHFSPTCEDHEIAKLYRNISHINRKINPQLTSESPEVQELKEERHDLYVRLKQEKNRYFDKIACDASQKLEQKEFSWHLMEGPVVSGKQTFSIDDEALSWFFSQQVIRELRLRTNPLRGRDYIISGLKQTLDKTCEHHIYRTDIHGFFESIPHDLLLDKLDSESGISQITLLLIRKLLSEYASLTGNSNGIPRGVGISSQLSELYLRDLDNVIIYNSSVLYYARYVDDIVMVTATSHAMDQAKSQLREDADTLRLQLASSDPTKYADIDIKCGPKSKAAHINSFTFLGYKFNRKEDDNNSPFTQVRMSEAKIERLKTRMQISFEVWQRKTGGDISNGGANSLLLQRIRLLTGNTRLSGKKNVLEGIYFSNSSLTSEGVSELKNLDKDLRSCIRAYIPKGNKLWDRLNKCNFTVGYQQRVYIKLTPNKLNRITQIWK